MLCMPHGIYANGKEVSMWNVSIMFSITQHTHSHFNDVVLCTVITN